MASPATCPALLRGLVLTLCALNPALALHAASSHATVTTLDAVPGSGRFHHLAVDSASQPQYVYASDTTNHTIGRFELGTGEWQVVAGVPQQPGYRNGPGLAALFCRPAALCMLPGGRLAVADSGNACIRLVDTNGGEVTTLAGTCGEPPGFADGSADAALFGPGMKSVACLANCSVIVGDVGTGRLRRGQLQAVVQRSGKEGGRLRALSTGTWGCVLLSPGPFPVDAHRLIIVDDRSCPGQTAKPHLPTAAAWLGGSAALCLLCLAAWRSGQVLLAGRAAAAAARMEALRDAHTVPASEAAPAPSQREAYLEAAHRFHRRHRTSVVVEGAAAESLLEEGAGVGEEAALLDLSASPTEVPRLASGAGPGASVEQHPDVQTPTASQTGGEAASQDAPVASVGGPSAAAFSRASVQAGRRSGELFGDLDPLPSQAPVGIGAHALPRR